MQFCTKLAFTINLGLLLPACIHDSPQFIAKRYRYVYCLPLLFYAKRLTLTLLPKNCQCVEQNSTCFCRYGVLRLSLYIYRNLGKLADEGLETNLIPLPVMIVFFGGAFSSGFFSVSASLCFGSISDDVRGNVWPIVLWLLPLGASFRLVEVAAIAAKQTA